METAEAAEAYAWRHGAWKQVQLTSTDLNRRQSLLPACMLLRYCSTCMLHAYPECPCTHSASYLRLHVVYVQLGTAVPPLTTSA